MVNSVFKKKKKKRLILDPQERGREGGRDLLLSATMSMLPSLMRSLMNLFVRSSSISWHLIRSLKSGLSRKESLNSKVGSPIAPQRLNKKSCPFIHSPQLCMYASVRPHKFQFRCDTVVSKFHLQPPPSPPKKRKKKKSFPAPLSSSLPLWFSPLPIVKLAVVWLLLVTAGYFTAARCGPEAADLLQEFRRII